MSALMVIVTIAVLSIVGPFVLRLHRSSLVWITLAIVNLIIVSLYITVRDSSPDILRPLT